MTIRESSIISIKLFKLHKILLEFRRKFEPSLSDDAKVSLNGDLNNIKLWLNHITVDPYIHHWDVILISCNEMYKKYKV